MGELGGQRRVTCLWLKENGAYYPFIDTQRISGQRF